MDWNCYPTNKMSCSFDFRGQFLTSTPPKGWKRGAKSPKNTKFKYGRSTRHKRYWNPLQNPVSDSLCSKLCLLEVCGGDPTTHLLAGCGKGMFFEKIHFSSKLFFYAFFTTPLSNDHLWIKSAFEIPVWNLYTFLYYGTSV